MEIFSDKWISRFLSLSHEIATWSKDPSTQVGAVIIRQDGTPVSFGYNGMPRGVDDSIQSRMNSPTKYNFMEHAERNALYQASRLNTQDGILFVTHLPCCDCARGIIQCGIKTVVVNEVNGINSDFAKNRWDQCGFKSTLEMFEESGVKLIQGNI